MASAEVCWRCGRVKRKAHHPDTPATCCGADTWGCLNAALARVTAERDEARAELDAAHALFPPLLRGVALALKGPEAEQGLHDWSDLPDVAARVVRERDSEKARADAAEAALRERDHRQYDAAGNRAVLCWCGAELLLSTSESAKEPDCVHQFRWCTPRASALAPRTGSGVSAGPQTGAVSSIQPSPSGLANSVAPAVPTTGHSPRTGSGEGT